MSGFIIKPFLLIKVPNSKIKEIDLIKKKRVINKPFHSMM